MGKALPAGVGAEGTPPTGGKPWTNGVVEGTISGLGPTLPFAFYGAFNVAVWGQVNTALTTNAASRVATVAAVTGLLVGQSVISTLAPQGATVSVVGSTTTINLGGLTTAQVAGLTSASDPAALFEHAIPEATVRLERSFDGGVTWLTAGVGGGAPASWTLGAATITWPISVVAAEPEQQVAYRLNCVAYTSGTIRYRLSATGAAAMSWAVNVG